MGRRERKSKRASEANLAQAIAKVKDVEIDDQPKLPFGEFEVGSELGKVKRKDLRNRLDFNDDPVFDEQVEPKATVEIHAFKVQGDFLLLCEIQLVLRKGPAQTRLIRTLEQTGAQRGMNSQRTPDDPS